MVLGFYDDQKNYDRLYRLHIDLCGVYSHSNIYRKPQRLAGPERNPHAQPERLQKITKVVRKELLNEIKVPNIEIQVVTFIEENEIVLRDPPKSQKETQNDKKNHRRTGKSSFTLSVTTMPELGCAWASRQMDGSANKSGIQ